MGRRAAFVGCVVVGLALFSGSASAAGPSNNGAYNNLVQLNNSDSTHPAVQTSTDLTMDTGSQAVTNANLAYSTSSNCTGCRTVGVAVQAVIVEGTPTSIAPQNAAVAVNDGCQSCQTFAYAQQYVFLPEHPVTISRETLGSLTALTAAMTAVANSNESFETMDSQLNDLSWAYCEAVQQAIQSSGPNPGPAVCGAPPFDRVQMQSRTS